MMNQIQRAVTEELISSYTVPVRDPLWKHIYISKGMEALLHCPQMTELAGIRQLGPTHLLYPGAVHTRLSHSLGVFHLARQMLISLLQTGSLSGCTPEGVRAFLTASLLHDLGHFPYTHSLKGLPLKDHEQLGSEIISSSRELSRVISESMHTDPAMVCAVIDEGIETSDPEIMIYRSLLSGPLDPDKLDYLNRDAYFCGVPYGIQDIDYIISKLHWSQEHMKPGMETSGLGALENLIFSKYLMYRYVYWHRTVRSATAMVKHALFSGLSEGIIAPEDLYYFNDESFLRLCSSRSYPPFSLVEQVRQNRLYQCSMEIPFDSSSPEHLRLLDLPYRLQREQELSCGSEIPRVIIDIPEGISLECNIPLISSRKAAEPVHILTPEVIDSMQRSLRIIRVFVSPDMTDQELSSMEQLSL